jgi:hypothetical protein
MLRAMLDRRRLHALRSRRIPGSPDGARDRQGPAFASFEDLGVQMNHHSTLVSYLHRLLIVLTGSFGTPGTHFIPTTLVDIGNGAAKHVSPVAGARIVGGLVPCNVIAEEILDRSPQALPRDDRRGRQPGALARRLQADARGARRARHARRDRRRDERDREARPLRPARRDAVREGRGDVLQLRLPGQLLPPAPPLFAPPTGRSPRPRSTRGCARRSARSPRPIYAPLARPPRRAARRTRRRSWQLLANPRLSGVAPGAPLPHDGDADRAQARARWCSASRSRRRWRAVRRSRARASAARRSRLPIGAVRRDPARTPSGVVFAVDEWTDVLRAHRRPIARSTCSCPDLLEELGDPLRVKPRSIRRSRSCCHRRRAPVVHRQHDHARSRVAQEGRRRRAADPPRRMPRHSAWPPVIRCGSPRAATRW